MNLSEQERLMLEMLADEMEPRGEGVAELLRKIARNPIQTYKVSNMRGMTIHHEAPFAIEFPSATRIQVVETFVNPRIRQHRLTIESITRDDRTNAEIARQISEGVADARRQGIDAGDPTNIEITP